MTSELYGNDIFGMALVRWFDRYLSQASDDALNLLDGDVPGSGRVGFPDQMTRAEWTRGAIEAKLTILRQWFGGEADAHRDYVKGEGGSRGRYADVPVTRSITTAFNSFAAPLHSIWLNEYRRQVLSHKSLSQKAQERPQEPAKAPAKAPAMRMAA